MDPVIESIASARAPPSVAASRASKAGKASAFRVSCLAIKAALERAGVDGKEVETAAADQLAEVVVDRTPFYGESGGQVGDCGRITAAGLEMEVSETVKDPTGLFIHKGKIRAGRIKKGQSVTLIVDEKKRGAIALNHTATHILHAALRNILGDHVKQGGSMVSPERLRFDFTHFSSVDRETLDTIENYGSGPG